ncbi:hypothetical protein [Shewanella gelidii]|uniref:Uncharacterized protein n=1 Tax=Shewanella gelidii TaxID=1642821 RepID=A0A917NCH8_9GAMM|nr:hypothetical protein [Shewanella gelidii]GGI87393.1 hypothetical protein GCM10009332_25770 [Shewanella gelidii]
MLTFLKNNLGIIIAMLLLGGLILGGIYYVETSLANQVQVIN